MRLSKTEMYALRLALSGVSFPVFLFGSRTDQTAKGGDIDLLILAKGLDSKACFELSIKVAVAFKNTCDEKIDVVVLDSDHLTAENRAFLESISKLPLEFTEP